jgi:hypothetical protein
MPRPSFIRVVIPVWLVTAVWDFMCASALTIYVYHGTFAHLWQGVASTIMGPTVLDNGSKPVAVGIALHFLVAFIWSALFVAAVYSWPALRRAIATPAGALTVALVYGPIIWLVMSLVVIPLAVGHLPRIGFRWWVQIVAHPPFVTIPMVFMTRRMLGQMEPAPSTAPSVATAGG